MFFGLYWMAYLQATDLLPETYVPLRAAAPALFVLFNVMAVLTLFVTILTVASMW